MRWAAAQVVLGLWLAGCGSQVARTSGTISGQLAWSGTWPQAGIVLVALFDVPPWDPAFVPGPPVAYRLLDDDAGSPATFALADPGVPFDTYGALVVAWQDPEPVDQSAHMLPLSVWGTDLENLEAAVPIVLSPDTPDREGLELSEMVLYSAAADMRLHYSPVQ